MVRAFLEFIFGPIPKPEKHIYIQACISWSFSCKLSWYVLKFIGTKEKCYYLNISDVNNPVINILFAKFILFYLTHSLITHSNASAADNFC